MQRGGEDGQAQGLRVVAEAVHDLAAIRRRYAKGLRLACNGGADAARLAELHRAVRNGSCPIVVEYRNHGVGGELELPDAWSVSLDDPLLARCATGSRRRTSGWCIDRPLIARAHARGRAAGCGGIANFCCCGARKGVSADRLADHAHGASDRGDLIAGAGAIDLGLLTVALTLPGAVLAWFGGGMGRSAPPPSADDRRRPRPRGGAAVDSRSRRSAGAVTLPLLYAVAVVTGHRDRALPARRPRVRHGPRRRASACSTPTASARPRTPSPRFPGPRWAARWSRGSPRRIAIAVDARDLRRVGAAARANRRSARSIAPPQATSSFVDDVRTGIRVVWRDARSARCSSPPRRSRSA